MNLHGPSLGIGAGIASVSVILAFFAFSLMIQPEVELKQAGTFPNKKKRLHYQYLLKMVHQY